MSEVLADFMRGGQPLQRQKETSEESSKDQTEGAMSHDEMNALAAKIIKAEAMGNMVCIKCYLYICK